MSTKTITPPLLCNPLRRMMKKNASKIKPTFLPKKADVPIDVSHCCFNIFCITIFGKQKLVLDVKTMKLSQFKVYAYNAKATKTV